MYIDVFTDITPSMTLYSLFQDMVCDNFKFYVTIDLTFFIKLSHNTDEYIIRNVERSILINNNEFIKNSFILDYSCFDKNYIMLITHEVLHDLSYTEIDICIDKNLKDVKIQDFLIKEKDTEKAYKFFNNNSKNVVFN